MKLPGGRRQWIAAGAIAVVAVAVVFGMRDDDPAAPAPRSARRAGASRQGDAPVPVVDVNLEALTDRRPDLAPGPRNPFRFQPKAAPPEARSATPQRPVAPVVPQVPSGPPPPPPIPLRFIGLVEAPRQAARVAILSDGRGNVFYGKEGDIIEGRYRLLRIGVDTAELSYTDGRGRQTIRLSGQ